MAYSLDDSSPVTEISRRAALLAILGCSISPMTVWARGRKPVGGKLRIQVPWPLGSVDPHEFDDLTASLLSSALFESLYRVTTDGLAVPQLAEALPERKGTTFEIRLRKDLRSARGKSVQSKDVVASIERARRLGSKAWLGDIGSVTSVGDLLLVATKNPVSADELAYVLASPWLAIVPKAFDPDLPDGTGPFRFERRGDGWAMVRNPFAANGPSFIEEIFIGEATDLSSSLRAFESGKDDIGWLGTGLHEPRPKSQSFDAGMLGWAILRVGKEAGSWEAPGVAQRVCDGLPSSRLSYLRLGTPWKQEALVPWQEAPQSIVVREDSPWLVELAKAIAASLSTPGHELSVRPTAIREVRALRQSRGFCLMVDTIRALPLTWVALGSADNMASTLASVQRKTKIPDVPPRSATRLLRLGVIGEIRAQGGKMPNLSIPAGASGIDWGFVTQVENS